MINLTCTVSGQRAWRRGLLADAALLALVLAASPSGATDCDGYVGGEAQAVAFWSVVSEHELHACIAAHGVDVRDDEYGGTPLHWAAGNGNPTAVRILVEADADVEAESRTGATPLQWTAVFGNDPAVAVLLLDAGADPNARNENGRTTLHFAAHYNNEPALFVALVTAGADVDARDDWV